MISRHLLITGEPRATLDALAKEVASHARGTRSVRAAYPADEVPAIARQRWPDAALIVAHELPVHQLQDTLRWFRVSAHVPMIVVTGVQQVKHRLACIEQRVDDDAVSPVGAEELLARVERVARRSSGGIAARWAT